MSNNNNKEDLNKEELELEEDESLESEEDTLEEEQDEETSKEDDEDSEDDEIQKRADELLGNKKPQDPKSKASRAVYFAAQRYKELGGDPAEALGIKPKKQARKTEQDTDEPADIRSVVAQELDEREARDMVKSEAQFNLMKAYMAKGLSKEEAYLLVNKKQILRNPLEIKRALDARAEFSGGPSHKATKVEVPERPEEEVKLLQRRGLTFNQKTNTYRGKYTEEYYDSQSKTWQTRKLPRKS